MSTYLFYNRAKRADRNIINEAKITKSTKSPYTVYDVHVQLLRRFKNKKTEHIPVLYMILHVITATQIPNGSTYTFDLGLYVN